MSFNKIDLSDEAKLLLSKIFKNEPEKLDIIDKTINFVLAVISLDKINQYRNEIKKIIDIENNDNPLSVGAVEIMISIRKILEDLYSYLESIKESKLSKQERAYVKDNIDVIAQVIIVLAMDAIEDKTVINQDTLLKILTFVKVASVIDINMKVNRSFLLCCGSRK
ncbi:hypothetical protein QJ856_gp1135 [Tupanvirus deep ocean]|uniref:Uncharacterized protein n=2 Tax=Tupanvirus TaxID=2094720 RepID=A0AC62A7M0_9VIRU|nr:hypothetical protein QJ856_gp1135 [Tupanvirus deep ocean]QKU33623.1 hypothetical protein [Tupanvirus deep ocean]